MPGPNRVVTIEALHPAEVADAVAGFAETPDTALPCVWIIFFGAKMLRFRAAATSDTTVRR